MKGYVVFTTTEVPEVDYRFDGQALPTGARVLLAGDDEGNRAVLHGYGDEPAIAECAARAVQEARLFDPTFLLGSEEA